MGKLREIIPFFRDGTGRFPVPDPFHLEDSRSCPLVRVNTSRPVRKLSSHSRSRLVPYKALANSIKYSEPKYNSYLIPSLNFDIFLSRSLKCAMFNSCSLKLLFASKYFSIQHYDKFPVSITKSAALRRMPPCNPRLVLCHHTK